MATILNKSSISSPHRNQYFFRTITKTWTTFHRVASYPLSFRHGKPHENPWQLHLFKDFDNACNVDYIFFLFGSFGSSWLVVEVLVNSPGEIVPSLHPKRWSLHLGSTTPEGLCQSKIESAKCRCMYINMPCMDGMGYVKLTNEPLGKLRESELLDTQVKGSVQWVLLEISWIV